MRVEEARAISSPKRQHARARLMNRMNRTSALGQTKTSTLTFTCICNMYVHVQINVLRSTAGAPRARPRHRFACKFAKFYRHNAIPRYAITTTYSLPVVVVDAAPAAALAALRRGRCGHPLGLCATTDSHWCILADLRRRWWRRWPRRAIPLVPVPRSAENQRRAQYRENPQATASRRRNGDG